MFKWNRHVRFVDEPTIEILPVDVRPGQLGVCLEHRNGVAKVVSFHEPFQIRGKIPLKSVLVRVAETDVRQKSLNEICTMLSEQADPYTLEFAKTSAAE